MKIRDILKVENIFIYHSIECPDELYGQFATDLKDKSIIIDDKQIKRLFVKREILQSTAIGKGAATPHIYSTEFKKFFIAAAVIKDGIHYMTPDNNPVHVVFLIMSDERYVGKHLKTLSLIAKLVDQTPIVNMLKDKSNKDEIYNILIQQGEKIN